MLILMPVLAFHAGTRAQSKQLWGITSSGGNGGGVIFHTNGHGKNYTVAWAFLENPGANPGTTRLCEATDGKLYGMTWAGGALNFGVIFRLDPSTGGYERLFDFDGLSSGMNPEGSLIQATDGKCYGMASSGGANLLGTLFRYDPSSQTFSKILNFDGPQYGRQPQGSLMQASNGKLYGMTAYGGAYDSGCLFSWDPSSQVFTRLHDFSGTGGSVPWGSLVQASNGKLYGLTSYGGANNFGTLFSFDPATGQHSKLFDFSGPGTSSNGAYPYGELLEFSTGKLYGMAYGGGSSNAGLIFEYDFTSSTFTAKKDFTYTNGGLPNGSLMKAANGKLYGLTQSGGSSNAGILFEYVPSTNTLTTLYHFSPLVSGSQPWGTPVQASNGKLYGMTHSGGNGYGTIFTYDITAASLQKLLDFYGKLNGETPKGKLVLASDGMLYGTTQYGGSNGSGTIFRFDAQARTFSKLLDLSSTTGDTPVGGLVQGNDGKLYGLAYKGGYYGKGTLHRVDPATGQLNVRVSFSGTNGAHPSGRLVQAGNGKFYGLTGAGGTYGYGTLFVYDEQASTFTKLMDFDGTSKGRQPLGSLIQASNGKLYGLTYQGGQYSVGVLFSYDPVAGTFTKLYDFTGANISGGGALPSGELHQSSDGKLYGFTYQGGSSNEGTVFSYDIGTATLTKLYDLSASTTGKLPPAGLIEGGNGKLYGLCYEGGSQNQGTLIEYNRSSGVLIKKKDLGGRDGASPLCSLTERACTAKSSSLTLSSCGPYTSPSGMIWSNSGLYTDTVVASNGCDSVISINLSVVTVNTTVIPAPSTLTAMQPGAAYLWVDCMNNYAPVSGAVNQNFSPSFSGIYAVIITFNGCVDTSFCFPAQPTPGFGETDRPGPVTVHPNPGPGPYLVDLGFPTDRLSVEVLDVMGRMVNAFEHQGGRYLMIDVGGPSGMYYLKLTGTSARYILRLVKTGE
ncbi:MAG TPA: hypothetical protein P5550_02655 [Bacteroidales bacterium]|nr:hypothetical protein [Bacteroidales bacterium]